MDLLQLIFGALIGYSAAIFLRRPSEAKRMDTYPLCHVSFDSSMSTDERLCFLAEAEMAVKEGRLCKADQLKDDGTSDQAAKPGGDLED